ncbi:hypothetical protein T484DRAFT_1968496 [Baffinella frigidus]|nr:hypothetical protein T484DRAFT_1968496 [Cryptophyta sp. CCMP2293]
MPRALLWSTGGALSYERGTPVATPPPYHPTPHPHVTVPSRKPPVSKLSEHHHATVQPSPSTGPPRDRKGPSQDFPRRACPPQPNPEAGPS